MKKIIAIAVTILFLVGVIIAGCSNNKEALENYRKEATEVSGASTVCIRDVIPDYVLDSETPRVAIVTEYQSYPFTIDVPQNIAKQLKPDTIYTFTIKKFVVDEPVDQLESKPLSSIAWEYSDFEIVDFYEADVDSEWGVESMSLSFSEAN